MDASEEFRAAATPSRGFIILLGALTTFGTMSVDLYLPGLPAIAHDFGVSAGSVQLTMSAFLLGNALGPLLYGPLSDRMGRRAPLFAGIGVYLVATLGCAFAPSIGWLTAFRFLQALGGCAGMVITRAVVRDRFPVVEAARIYSLLMLVLGVGPILAPSLGAVLVGTLGWRGIFAFLAGFALCCGAAAYVFLPESRHAAARARAQDEALGHSLWAVLTNRLFLGYVLAGGLVNVATFAYIASAPDLLITTYHATMGQFGLAVSAVAAGYIASGPINRVLLRRYSFDRILRMALMASALAAVLLFVIGRMELFGLAGFLVPIGLIVTCLGFVQANALVGAMTSDAHRTGTIAALFGVIQGVLAATGATLAAATHDGTARPVISVILVGLLSALVAHTILVSGRKTVMN